MNWKNECVECIEVWADANIDNKYEKIKKFKNE